MDHEHLNVYGISRLLYDLKRPENRELYRANPAELFRRHSLGAHDIAALSKPDWRSLIEAGVSIYLLTKLAATSGADLLVIGAAARGMDRVQLLTVIADQNEHNRRFAIVPE
ncbi:MAG: hypothetical protein ACREQ4_11515 [Candidatus Binataceae bacterium]